MVQSLVPCGNNIVTFLMRSVKYTVRVLGLCGKHIGQSLLLNGNILAITCSSVGTREYIRQPLVCIGKHYLPVLKWY